jgi:hypothetical protein
MTTAEILSGGVDQPTSEHLARIDRGPRAATDGRFASDEKVAAGFAKSRGPHERTR